MSFDDYIEQCYCIAILELRISEQAFMDMTPYEFSLLVDYQRKIQKEDYQILRNVIFNAGANLLRKKGAKEITLFDDNARYKYNDKDVAMKEREELFGNQ